MMFCKRRRIKRKTTKTTPETEAGSSAHDFKKKDVVHVAKRTASFAMGDEGKASVRELVNQMFLVRSIYNVYFGNYAKEHKLGTREDLFGKVDLALTNPPYNRRRDPNKNHEDNDVIVSRDMEDMQVFME